MDILNILIGLSLMALVISIVFFYYEIPKEKKGGLTFKILTAGIGLFIMGLWIFVDEFLGK